MQKQVKKNKNRYVIESKEIDSVKHPSKHTIARQVYGLYILYIKLARDVDEDKLELYKGAKFTGKQNNTSPTVMDLKFIFFLTYPLFHVLFTFLCRDN